ncbi:MAG: DUF4097 family beta strand repeat protein [Bacilli bacterium]|nr:DUF4097 family beta strand repeat protein [Bacilli bacterium]
MKNKSNLMKILIIISLILITSLIVLVLFLYKELKMVKVDINKTRVITKNYDINKFEEISFDFKNAKVNYFSTDKDKLIIKQSGKTDSLLINIKETKKHLKIKEKQSSYFIKTNYEILIPSSYKNKINIINGFSNTKISNISNELYVNNNSGNVTITNINDLTMDNVSGSVFIDKVRNIVFNSSTGNINIDYLRGNTNITTITGDIKIDLFYVDSNSFIETTAGDINITVDKKSNCFYKVKNQSGDNRLNKKKCTGENNILKLTNITGNIIVE